MEKLASVSSRRLGGDKIEARVANDDGLLISDNRDNKRQQWCTTSSSSSSRNFARNVERKHYVDRHYLYQVISDFMVDHFMV